MIQRNYCLFIQIMEIKKKKNPTSALIISSTKLAVLALKAGYLLIYLFIFSSCVSSHDLMSLTAPRTCKVSAHESMIQFMVINNHPDICLLDVSQVQDRL